MGFTKIGLSDIVLRGVQASGYTIPTEIQLRAIPLALAGRDLICCAPTGTGKTAAFVLPILEHLLKLNASDRRHHFPKVLALTPTRELAHQIDHSVLNYGRFAGVRSAPIYGGVGMGNQISELQRGIDIVIATPGRLLDHMQRRTIDLSRVEILVLDEADRMYDMGFIHDVRRIISHVPKTRQTMLFSATMSSSIKSLVSDILKNPELIEIAPNSPVKTVDQFFVMAPQNYKLPILYDIIVHEEVESMLVFSRTKHGADRIAKRLLQQGVRTAAIHANRTQGQRRQALEGFKRGQFKVLVATDIAARGIDIVGVSHVVNYDVPAFAEDYVHRIGRTGRANHSGIAITLVSFNEVPHIRRIEALVGRPIKIDRYEAVPIPDNEALLISTMSKPSAERKGQGRGLRGPRKYMYGRRGK